jgi:hypothetical protein
MFDVSLYHAFAYCRSSAIVLSCREFHALITSLRHSFIGGGAHEVCLMESTLTLRLQSLAINGRHYDDES